MCCAHTLVVVCRDPSLFISDIVFSGADGDELAAARTSNPLPRNSHATEADIVAARNSLASTGLFSAISMSVYRDSNGDGHILEFKLKPNAEFKGHEVKGSRVLPPGLVDKIFAGAKGKTSDMNLYELVRAFRVLHQHSNSNICNVC